MNRPYRPTRTRWGLLTLSWFLRVPVLFLPTILVGYWGMNTLFSRINAILANAEPVISAIATQAVKRPVHVGLLQEELSVRTLYQMFRNREKIGVFPISVDDIVVSTKRTTYINKLGQTLVYDEPALTGSKTFASVPHATAYISMPSLLAGDFQGAVTRIEVNSPQAILARDSRGELNVEHILPSTPSSTPSQPFRTIIQINNGRLRFCDYASLSSPGKLAQNDIAGIGGVADLSTVSNYRFSVSAHAAPGTPTAAHLTGALSVDGSSGRVSVGEFPNGPIAESPRFLIHMNVAGADMAYWLYYFLNVGHSDPKDPKSKDLFRLEHGVANINLTVAAPRPDIVAGPLPGIGISMNARFAEGRIATGYLPTAIEDAHGIFSYEDGTASFSTTAQVLGAPLSGAGTLWNLTPTTPNGPQPIPEVAINVHAVNLSASRVLDALKSFMPKNGLPPGLRIGGDLGVDALISGPGNDPVAAARVSGLAVGMDGLPTARAIVANVVYSGGVLGVNNAAATLDGGGTLTGHAAVRVLAKTPGGAAPATSIHSTTTGDAEFAVRASNVGLDTLKVVHDLSSKPGSTSLRLSGKANVDAVGTMSGGTLSTAANVTTAGLTVGKIAIPVARARLLLTRRPDGSTQFVFPEARVESAVGAITATGNTQAAGHLNVRWAATNLDLDAIAAAAGIEQPTGVSRVAGLVSASGTVDGTPQDPRLVVHDLAGINLRVTTTSTEGSTRDFAIDSLRGANIVATRRGVALNQSLVLRRFPAMISIAGSVTDLLPTKPGLASAPRLHLTASLHDLEISEVENQLQESVGDAVKQKILGAAKAATTSQAPSIAGAITSANFTATGTVQNPTVVGSATLGNVLIGAYPIESGTLDFAYRNQETRLTNVAVAASVGTVTASATIQNSGEVTGTFDAKRLDLEKLSYLLRSSGGSDASAVPHAQTAAELTQAARLYGAPLVSGTIALSGAVQGTVHRIVVDAEIPETPLKVSGVALSGVGVQGLRFTDNLDAGLSRVEVGALTIHQNTDVTVPPVTGTSITPAPATGAPSATATGATLPAVAAAARRIAQSTITLNNVRVELPTVVGTSGVVSAGLTADTADVGALLITLRKADLLPFDIATKVGGPVQGRVAIDHLQVQGRLQRERNGRGEEIDRFVDGTGDATLSAANLTVGGFAAPVVAGQLHLSKERLYLDNLTATSPGATYRAHGDVGLDKTLNAVVESNAASIESLRTIPGLSGLPVIHGALDVSILARGTFDAPDISASIAGENLDVVTSESPAHGAIVPATAANIAAAENADNTFRLDILRATAEYTKDEKGESVLALSDGLITHGSASIRLGGTIPLGNEGPSTLRPIALTLSAPAMELKDLAPLFGGVSNPVPDVAPVKGKKGKKSKDTDLPTGKPVDLGGTLAFTATLGGTLANPTLTGTIDVVGAHFTAPKPPGDEKDHYNPIRNFDAHLVLRDQEVDFDKVALTLDGLNGKSGNFGSLNVGGTVGIGLLRPNALVNLLNPPANGAGVSVRDLLLQAPIAMTVGFNDFRPTDDNMFGFGEYVTAKANGTLTIGGNPKLANAGGTIEHALIATEGGKALRISDGDLKISSAVPAEQKEGTSASIAPRFNIPITLDGKSVISQGSLFRFEVNGNASLSGGLPGAGATSDILDDNGFKVRAQVKVVGGAFNITSIAHFTIQRSPNFSSLGITGLDETSNFNTVELRYGSIQPGLYAHNIVAVTRQYVGNSVNSSSKTSGTDRDPVSGNNLFASSSSLPSVTASGPQTAYTITAVIDGPLNILSTDVAGGEDSPVYGSSRKLVSFYSVPFLAGGDAAILSILGAQRELAQATNGDAQSAGISFVNHAIFNSTVPQALAPVTSGIQTALNLEDLSLSYDPSGYSQLFVAKRLPTPFDKVVVQYTQQVATHGSTQSGFQQQPYLFSLSYDLFQLHRSSAGLQPRVQTGFSTDEQHITTYFLRSSASF